MEKKVFSCIERYDLCTGWSRLDESFKTLDELRSYVNDVVLKDDSFLREYVAKGYPIRVRYYVKVPELLNCKSMEKRFSYWCVSYRTRSYNRKKEYFSDKLDAEKFFKKCLRWPSRSHVRFMEVTTFESL